MMANDEVVAVFLTKFESGDVRLVYCPHNRTYELRYAVRSQSDGGSRVVWSAVAFDACDYVQVAHMLVDARALVNTPLEERC